MKMKKWIVAFAGFLAFMWLCTVVSKSIYVTKLPVVHTVTTSKKYIEHTVEAQGIVEALDFIPVHTFQGLRINEILVHVGDYVEEGELLYTVDLEETKNSLYEKKIQLQKLNLTIQDKQYNDALDKNLKQIDLEWANEDFVRTANETILNVSIAKDNLDSAQKKLERHKKQKCDPEDVEAQLSFEAERISLEEAVESAKKALESAKLAQEASLTNSSREVAKQNTPGKIDSTLTSYELDKELLQNEINKLNSILKTEGNIFAPTSGYISSIQITAGARTLDSADITIADSTKPFYACFEITKEQSKYISLFDEVKLKINDKKLKSEIPAEVSYITNANSGGLLLRCKLDEASIVPGTSGTLKKNAQGKMYETVIPINALYKENGACYVYTVGTRDGILGEEKYIEKRNVNLIDQNEKFVAIESSIDKDTPIVESSSKTVKNGDVVRVE